MEIIKKGQDGYTLSFKDLLFPLTELLLSKDLDIGEICQTYNTHLLPADRITKFLKMIKKDIDMKGNEKSKREKMYLEEISYALSRINDRSLFKASSTLVNEHLINVCSASESDGVTERRLSVQWLNQYSDVGSAVESKEVLLKLNAL